MPLELIGEREHLAAGPAGVAAAAGRTGRCLAVDGGAVVAEVVGLRERPVAQLAGEGLGAVGQLMLLERSQLEQEELLNFTFQENFLTNFLSQSLSYQPTATWKFINILWMT